MAALQIRVGQRSITTNLRTLTTHIYLVMIIVTVGFSKKSFLLYYYFLEILLNNFELVFLEFKDFYKTHRTSLLSFHLFIFLLVILQSFCVLTLSPFPYFSTMYRHRMTLFSFYSFFCNHSCLLTLCTFCIFCISSSTKKKT